MSGVYLNLKNVTFVSAVDSLQLERYKWNKNFVLIKFHCSKEIVRTMASRIREPLVLYFIK